MGNRENCVSFIGCDPPSAIVRGSYSIVQDIFPSSPPPHLSPSSNSCFLKG
ncbi:MAG: hypothetical protein DSM106950_39060 [Stigonema ocellatum SAG 48.90 = DSM 106950]|nr:hypothetical protein [Stigonema ocellatum SAG 48.90 = DSM 106950]